MKRINIIVVAAASVLLSSCGFTKSLYGKYERPDSAQVSTNIVRDASGTGYINNTDTTGFGNLPWRSVFTDPQLQSLIEKALENNPDLLNAALNVDMAKNQLMASKLAFLPSFTFAPTGTISHFGTHTESTKAYTLPVSASWNIDLFGTLLSQKRAAQMVLLQSRDYQLAVKTSLISSVANMYYTLLMLDRQVEIVNDMAQLTKDTWDMMKLQMEYGQARSTSVQSAEAAYYSVQTQATDLQRQIRETENSLSLILGQPAQGIPRSTLDAQSLPAEFADGIAIGRLANRPDVHANEMALAQCFYNVETARSRFYPSINISPTGAFTNSNGMVNPGKWLFQVVGSLVQPIFQNGKLVAGLRVAKDQYQQAYNTWQNSILKAGNEVSNALALYNTSEEKSKLEAHQIKVLKQNVEDTRALMGSSTSTYLEVITAESSLLNVQLSKVQDDFNKMQAVVNLYYALGGGAK